MSIIVKGLELPENCRSCWFGLNLRDGEQDLCQLLERSCAVCDTRPDDCPLAEQTECKSDTDTISRRAAIDDIKAIYKWHDTVTEDRLIEHMKMLPPAQSEIIRCRDCKYWREHKYAKETKRYGRLFCAGRRGTEGA